MKNNLKKFMFGFILMFTLVINVNAQDVDQATFETCVSTEGSTCKLTSDINLSLTIDISKNVTIDLNGKNINGTANTFFNVNNSSLIVTGEGTITAPGVAFNLLGNTVPNGSAIKAELEIGANVQVVSETDNCIYIKGKGAKADVYGSLLSKGTYATIQGQGTLNSTTDNGNTVINIYDGASIIHNSRTAIYHPQSGNLTVYGGTIKGTTGIEMRAGELSVKGGTIIGTAVPTVTNSNGSGSTTLGAGIAIAQHTTKLDLNVTINGGTIQGYSAVYESNTENNSQDDLKKVSIDINGGTFETINGGTVAVYSQNATEFIQGGTFDSNIDKKYLSNNISLKQENGSYVVKTAWNIIVDQTKNGTVNVVNQAFEGDLVKLNIKPNKGYKVSSIKVLDFFDKEVKVTDNSFTMPKYPVHVEVTFEKAITNPDTADNLITFVVLSVIAGLGTVISLNRLRKNS